MGELLKFKTITSSGCADLEELERDPVAVILSLIGDALEGMALELRERLAVDESADLSIVVAAHGQEFLYAVHLTHELPELLETKFAAFLSELPPGPAYVRLLGMDTGIARWLAPDGREAAENPGYLLHAAGLVNPVLSA